MKDKYECIFCKVGVEYETKDVQEHNQIKCCQFCYEKESDTGEVC